MLFTHLRNAVQVNLTRFDLFHAHVFYVQHERQLGLLFHAKEFPAFDNDRFPYNLGYCQWESPLEFTEAGMDWRNMLWYKVLLHLLFAVGHFHPVPPPCMYIASSHPCLPMYAM